MTGWLCQRCNTRASWLQRHECANPMTEEELVALGKRITIDPRFRVKTPDRVFRVKRAEPLPMHMISVTAEEVRAHQLAQRMVIAMNTPGLDPILMKLLADAYNEINRLKKLSHKRT